MVTGYIEEGKLMGYYMDVSCNDYNKLVKSFLDGVMLPTGEIYKPIDGVLQIRMKLSDYVLCEIGHKSGRAWMIDEYLVYLTTEQVKGSETKWRMPKVLVTTNGKMYDVSIRSKASVVLIFIGKFKKVTSLEDVSIDFDTEVVECGAFK